VFLDALNSITEEGNWVNVLLGDIRVLQCLKCNYRSRFPGQMKKHINSKHSSNPITFGCPYCPYRAKQKVHIKIHVATRHGSVE
jgi:hypothetical protein